MWPLNLFNWLVWTNEDDWKIISKDILIGLIPLHELFSGVKNESEQGNS